MIVSALSSHFALCAFVLHYHISMPQSPDGIRIIFNLLYMFWHNHSENFALAYNEQKYSRYFFLVCATLKLGPSFLTSVRRVQKSPLLEADVDTLVNALVGIQAHGQNKSLAS